jgi:tetratricopeptide (TPR) repeat protein
MRVLCGILTAAWLAFCVVPAFADTRKDNVDCAANDYERAIAGCTRVIKTPGMPLQNKLIAHSNIANLLIGKGDLSAALLECDEIIRLDPKQMLGYKCRGIAHLHAGDANLAIADFNQAIRINPKSGSALASRGRAYQDKGDLDSAMTDVNESIRAEPNGPNTYLSYYYRASIEQIMKNLDASLDDVTEAIRLKPDYGQLYADRGVLWRQKGNLDRALADQEKAIQFQPQSASNRVERGTTQRYRGNFQASLADFDGALKLQPDFITALAGRGLTFEKMGDPARARADFQHAIDSKSQERSGPAPGAFKTAKAHLAALESGAPQPVIPSLPSQSGSSIYTPAVVVPAAVTPPKNVGRRAALVIGNSAYRNAPALANPQHDAEVVAASLRAIGFTSVTLVQNATHENLTDALQKFGEEARKSDWAMIYYAGHGIEVNGINYLIPIDAKLSTDRDVQYEAVPMDQAMASIEGASKLKLIMLDACRDNPFAPKMHRTAVSTPVFAQAAVGGTVGTRSVGRGLSEVKVNGATLVVYAAKQGETALDGDGGNSPFAVAFVQRIATPNVEINKLVRLVRDDVIEATGGRQEPYTYGSLPGNEDFFFVTK